MRALLLLSIALASPAAAQHADHSTMDHSAHGASPPPTAPAVDPHAGHDMGKMGQAASQPDPKPIDHSGMDHSGMDHAAPSVPTGTAGPPPIPKDHYADRDFPAAEMERARGIMMRQEGGAQNFHLILFDLAELRAHKGRDSYHWDGEGWFGGDVNRLVVKSEGEGSFGRGGADAEVQALYSRALDPYWNLQAGIRQDIGPGPSPSYAVIGVEGLAPYWFEIEAALFLSDDGDVLARLSGYYDQRLTQRLILQPRAELDFAAQDVEQTGTGSGLSTVDLGLRLRYEIAREFAPYVGIAWERSFGDTARFVRAKGDKPETTSFVMGIRAWF